MTVPTLRHPMPSLMFEQLMQQMGISYGDNFTACRRLVTLIEDAGSLMSETDRTQIARLMTAAGHSLLLSCNERS